MANLINATVYQIDGNPQKVPTVVAFDTDKIRLQETTLSTIPAVNTFIEVQGEKLNSPVVKYFVSEIVSSLVSSANAGGTTLLQATVVAINENPFKTSLQMAFPANKVTVWEFISGDIQSFLQFNEDKFYATETKSTLVTAANVTSGGGVQSVTGFGVDNIDPLNPIVNSFTSGTLTATGTNRNNAAEIVDFTTNINNGGLNTGVKLPLTALFGHRYYIYNSTATAKNVYAAPQAYVNNVFIPGTTGITLNPGFILSFTLTSVGWLVNQEQVKETAPYKVYTALLAQSGGDGPNDADNFPLEIGVTYTIGQFGTYVLGDFTNVGAPNNNIGTSFVATGTTPNSWGTNISLSWNSGAPVVTVLENTIGNIWFTYDADGLYYANSSGLFITDKITPFIGTQGVNILSSTRVNTNLVEILTYDMSIGNTANNILSNTPIEIRVYN